jgi:hypothetical protein
MGQYFFFMRKIWLIGLLLAVMALAVGCASYSAKGMMPTQINESKVVKSEKDGISITAFPILTEKDSKEYFDDNLIEKRLLCLYLNIENHSQNIIKPISISVRVLQEEPIGHSSTEDVYKTLKREWLGKSAFWWFFGLYVGAPISAAHTSNINDRIEKDLNGKYLKFNEVGPKESLLGFVCFKIPQKTMPEPDKGFPRDLLFKIVFKNNSTLIEYNLSVSRSSK